MINSDDAKDFLDLMCKYISFYEEFIALEKHKMNALSLNQLDQLDQNVKEEEAFLMQAKGMDQKKDSFLSAYQLSDKKMSDVIPLFPQPYQDEIQQKFNVLSDILLDLKAINSRCNTMTEIRLHKIQEKIAEIQGKAKQQNVRMRITKKGSKKEGRLSQKV